MELIELTIQTTTEASELVADVLWRYTRSGVVIADVNDILGNRWCKPTHRWGSLEAKLLPKLRGGAFVLGCLPAAEATQTIARIEADFTEYRKNARNAIPFGSLEITQREIDESEANTEADLWERLFRPVSIGKLVVVPHGIDYTPKEGEVVLTIDARRAFGSGRHETTALCLELLQAYLEPDSVCIDVGCGCGILGIAAVKLGARRAYLTDRSIVAVRETDRNCQNNGTTTQIIVAYDDLLRGTDVIGQLIVANLRGEECVRLAAVASKNLCPSGILILSGVTEPLLHTISETYAAFGYESLRCERKGEWYAFVFRKK